MSYDAVRNLIFTTEVKTSDLFTNYYQEFFSTKDDQHCFVAMFLNMIRDFLDGKISGETLSALIHHSLFDARTQKYHYPPFLWQINDVLALLHELLDLMWTQGSADYDAYLDELNVRVHSLASKYR